MRRSPARSPGQSTHDPLATIGAPALLLLLLSPPSPACLAAAGRARRATIETTLSTRDEQIRQLAFDGDDASFFESQQPPGADITSRSSSTGRSDSGRSPRSPAGPTGDAVRASTLEVSADGTTFRVLARFAGGTACGGPADGTVRAIRIKPGPADGPIAIRELTIDSDPPVAAFRYPVEFVVDTADVPDLKPWAESTVCACERHYAMINDELGSDGYRPPRRIWLALSSSYRGVAKMSGDHIVGSADHFRGHRKDVGAIVHETVHVVQGYRRGERPSWLVEGMCDYIRFFKWSRGTWGGSTPRRQHYNRS